MRARRVNADDARPGRAYLRRRFSLISSALFSRRSLFASVAVACALAACADSSALSDFAGNDSSNGVGDDGGGGPFSSTGQDAAPTEKAGVFRGNPLCNVSSQKACMPDEDGSKADACATKQPPDAGADASADGSARGCRLTKSTDPQNPTVAPDCRSASYSGTDGVACTTGADCAPGFDCVGADTGTGTFCRRYCCLGTCGAMSSNSGGTFCDVQKLVDTGSKAPVCMPLKPCTLLSTEQCANDETCAVVNDGGETGCVPRGDAQNGQPCDDTHCALNLTCLGQPGNRKCQTLCKVGSTTTCTGGQVCKTTSAFKDSAFGICQAL